MLGAVGSQDPPRVLSTFTWWPTKPKVVNLTLALIQHGAPDVKSIKNLKIRAAELHW